VCSLEQAGYTVVFERVQTAEAMRTALERRPWDVVLSDYSMPSFSANGALSVLQESGRDLPFIIISGTIGEDVAVNALKAGAHDFLVKGRLARLAPAIERERRDVADRHRRRHAEEALRASEAQYRSLVEHAVFGIYQATEDDRFIAVNPALVAMLGYEQPDELLAVDVGTLYASADRYADIKARSRTERRLAGEEVIWTRKSGDEIRVRLSGRLTEERLTGRGMFEIIVEDVTEQHRLQEQLRQSQKMEAVGQLAGGVAHDFNNMLTAILGYTELLTDQIGPDKPIGQDLLQIKAAAERAAALTRQLLAFSRRQVLTMTAVHLSEVVDALAPMLRRLLGAPIAIETTLTDRLHPVMADVAQLEHLLMNLSLNARDAMPGGGVLTITTANVDLDAAYVSRHPGATAGAHAALSVADTGTGMPPEVMAKIFEPFFTTKARGQGTGLGLAAVYGTVKQLGGYIDVQSEVGLGSTFTIYLPKTSAEVQSHAEPQRSGAPVGRETILLVEDENGVRAFAKIAMQRFGYRVLEADSAEAALKLLADPATKIDLLLTDVVLPGMDGRALAAQVLRDRPATRLLFMSGYTDRLGSTGGVLEPGLELLEKPFAAQTLLVRTRQILEAR
jgi:PAS domain S-box-containing protein